MGLIEQLRNKTIFVDKTDLAAQYERIITKSQHLAMFDIDN
jgi:hypothetical protein